MKKERTKHEYMTIIWRQAAHLCVLKKASESTATFLQSPSYFCLPQAIPRKYPARYFSIGQGHVWYFYRRMSAMKSKKQSLRGIILILWSWQQMGVPSGRSLENDIAH